MTRSQSMSWVRLPGSSEIVTIHGDLAHLGLQPGDIIVAVIPLALFQSRGGPRQSPIPPFAQLLDGDIGLASHQFQRLPAEEAGHDRHLALNGKTPALGANLLFLGHFHISGCGSNYRSRLSHLTVPHPKNKE